MVISLLGNLGGSQGKDDRLLSSDVRDEIFPSSGGHVRRQTVLMEKQDTLTLELNCYLLDHLL